MEEQVVIDEEKDCSKNHWALDHLVGFCIKDRPDGSGRQAPNREDEQGHYYPNY